MSKYYNDTQRKDSFFANNVRLITFLIVIAVFLVTVGWIFVLNAQEWFGGDPRPTISKRDVVLLSTMELDSGISIDRVTQFECEETIAQSHIEIILPLDTEFKVIIKANPKTKIITSGSLVNSKRNETKDLFEDDIDAYFSYLEKLEQAT